ncbi:MAG: ligase-associated DNA damage response exonuclease [Alphaproteobacteria bacterium]|nr:ligase-associated DNA damage response exonuclease [Alphaproteobacteria bacterium]
MHPSTWLKATPAGLYVEPGGFHIDPTRAVSRALVTHGHGDHARPGNENVLATKGTLEIMRARFAGRAGGTLQEARYGEKIEIGGVSVEFAPAGHVLGSAQIRLTYKGARAVVSGDYKRAADPTCPPFEPMACDVFVTEATFALPVFRHPPAKAEIARLLASVALYPERCHLVGAYSLGKCQRVIAEIRAAGYAAPIYLHGAHETLCAVYVAQGVDLGELRPAAGAISAQLRGAIVLYPPFGATDAWLRRMPDPVMAGASGWYRVKQRAKAAGLELALVISDHADWDELLATLADVAAPEVWVTHGREDALVHEAKKRGFDAKALHLVGFEDEGS